MKDDTDMLKFERTAAQFSGLCAKSVGKWEITSLVFASPLSARSPDLCLLWHNGYRNKHKHTLTVKYLFLTPFLLVKSVYLLLKKLKPLSYALYGKENDSLIVIPSTCGKFNQEGIFLTEYIKMQKDDCFFLFGPQNSCGKREKNCRPVSLYEKIEVILSLIKAGFFAYLKIGPFSTESYLLFYSWIKWALSFQWLSDYQLEIALSGVICESSFKKIACVHELHAYARIVWRLALRNNLKSYTLQHAAIGNGKRWYFAYPEEKNNGLILPSIFYVYNNDAQKLLRPYFQGTDFKYGCSYRYAHWKNADKQHSNGKFYLFAGALAGFDNDVLLKCVKKIVSELKDNDPKPLKLRMHPFAIVSNSDKRWLKTAQMKGIVEISKNRSLAEDLKDALVVIGMNSTVLEEALLLGKPAIQITHRDYLKYIDLSGISGAKILEQDNFSINDLRGLGSAEINRNLVMDRFGLSLPEVTYEQIFS